VFCWNFDRTVLQLANMFNSLGVVPYVVSMMPMQVVKRKNK